MVEELMDTGLTQHDNWLLLTDYASKYRISVSTLRRRIKSDTIKYRLDHGRYLIFDEAPTPIAHHETPAGPIFGSTPAPMAEAPVESALAAEMAGQMAGLKVGDEPILSSATRILNELKRAYTNILQEKEEQIIQLKEEVSDLKTLVRVLESDNDRMRRLINRPLSQGLDSWDPE